MTLKLATLDDYDRVEALICNFYGSQNLPYGEIQLDKIRALFDNTIDSLNPDTVMILWIDDNEPQGLIAGQCTEVVFNSNRVATELAWWVEPEYRKGKAGAELLRSFEYWAKLRDCKFVQMIGLHNEYSKVLGRYYTQQGYGPAESSYVKEL